MDIGLDEIRELIEILNQSSLSELKLETADVKISLKKGAPVEAPPPSAPTLAVTYAETPVGAGAAPATAAAPAAAAPPDRANQYLIRAPMVGTFYRAPSPEAPPFVEVGQVVEPGQTVCIIEAMKLMNELEAEHGGKVVRVCLGSGEPVEFGQVLFEIER